MAESNGAAVNLEECLIEFPSAAGVVYVDPFDVVAVASGELGRSMLFIGGGAVTVNMPPPQAAAIIARARGKSIVSLKAGPGLVQ